MRGQCTSQAPRQLSRELFWNARQTPCQRTAYLPTTDTGEQREKRACAGKFLPDIFSVCFKDDEDTPHPPLYPGRRLWGSSKNRFSDRNSCPCDTFRTRERKRLFCAPLCPCDGLGEDPARSALDAATPTVCQRALPRIPIAPQPRSASATDNAVAPFAQLGGASGVHGAKQRKPACRADDRQSGNHRFLPWHVSAPAVRT